MCQFSVQSFLIQGFYVSSHVNICEGREIFVTIYTCLKIQSIQVCSFKITDNCAYYFEIKVGIALL